MATEPELPHSESNMLLESMHAPSTGIAVENGYGQLVVEMGIFGLIIWITLGVAICRSAWKIVKKLRGTPYFPIAFVIFWFAFLIFFPMGYTSLAFYQDFLVSAYFWILLGILFRLPKLAAQAHSDPAMSVGSASTNTVRS